MPYTFVGGKGNKIKSNTGAKRVRKEVNKSTWAEYAQAIEDRGITVATRKKINNGCKI